MCGKSFYSAFLMFMLSLTAGVAFAGVDYGDPDGGWTYIYTGDAAAVDAEIGACGSFRCDQCPVGDDQIEHPCTLLRSILYSIIGWLSTDWFGSAAGAGTTKVILVSVPYWGQIAS